MCWGVGGMGILYDMQPLEIQNNPTSRLLHKPPPLPGGGYQIKSPLCYLLIVLPFPPGGILN